MTPLLLVLALGVVVAVDRLKKRSERRHARWLCDHERREWAKGIEQSCWDWQAFKNRG